MTRTEEQGTRSGNCFVKIMHACSEHVFHRVLYVHFVKNFQGRFGWPLSEKTTLPHWRRSSFVTDNNCSESIGELQAVITVNTHHNIKGCEFSQSGGNIWICFFFVNQRHVCFYIQMTGTPTPLHTWATTRGAMQGCPVVFDGCQAAD